MLTDYHVHLRPDELDATAAEHFTPANVERYREAAERARDRRARRLRARLPLPRRRSSVWQPPVLARVRASTTSTTTARFVREQTDLRLGIEADFVPGRRGSHRRTCSRRATATTWSARSTSSATAPSTWTTTTSGTSARRSAEKVWRRYFETLGEAARSGLFDILAHPDLVKVLGRRARRCPRATCAATTSRRSRRSPSRASPSRSRRPACASRSARSTRRRRSSQMCLEAGVPVALSSDAHRARARRLRLRAGARAARTSSGVRELCVFERRAAAAWSRSARAAGMSAHAASATTRTGSSPGRRLILGGVEIAQRARARRATPTPTCSRTRSPTRCSARPALGDIGEHFPDTDERWRGADSIALLAAVVRDARRARATRSSTSTARSCWRRRSSRPHRDAIRARLAAALGLDAETRQREGDAPARGSASSGAARARRRWRSRRSRSRRRVAGAPRPEPQR